MCAKRKFEDEMLFFLMQKSFCAQWGQILQAFSLLLAPFFATQCAYLMSEVKLEPAS